VWTPNTTPVTDYCPVVSDTNISARFATQIDVYGWSTGPGTISATACRSSISGGNAVCATATTSTATNAADHLAVFPTIGGAGWGGGSNEKDGFYVVIAYKSSAAIFNYSFTS